MIDDLSVVPARPEHIYHLIKKIRAKDRDFIWTFAGCRPYEFLTRSFTMSPVSFSCLKKGEPLCIFGVSSSQIMSKTGTLWLAACDEVSCLRPGTIILRGRKYFRIFNDHFDKIEYFVESSNGDGIRKLRKLGFSVSGETLPGTHGKLFHRAWLQRTYESQDSLFARNISKTSRAHN